MSATTLTFHGRLPGVDCAPALPAREQPVRLDVTGFVGLAERGPVDLPVPVEDANQYAAVFGADLALAQEAGAPVYAQLPLAVRSFFDNGGRRCHVVRVAGADAIPARWVLPGVEIWQPGGSTRPVVVEAAWPGAWSAGTTLSTALQTQHLPVAGDYVRATDTEPGVLPLEAGATVGLQVGDVLRLDLGALRPGVFVRVQGLDRETVRVDLELPVAPVVGGPDPGALAALPPSVEVVDARLHRFDLVVHHRGQSPGDPGSLDRFPGLGFTSWPDALQPHDDHQPDLSRSMDLRQDAETIAAMVTGLALPVGMAEPSTATDPSGTGPADPSGNPSGQLLLQPGDDDLDTLEHAVFVDPLLARDTVHSLLGHADQLTALAPEPVALRGIHALLPLDEVAIVAVPDATQRSWAPVDPVPPPVSPPPPEPEPVDWSDFRCCDDMPASVPVEASTPAPTVLDLPELEPPAAYDDQRLEDLHVAVVTMCAARADQVAVLSVPRHYDVPAVLAWRELLSADGRVGDASGEGVSPLTYAAMWHPWISVATGQQGSRALLREVPPDGAVAGMIAARELARGAWIAPAGQPLRGVVRLATTRPLGSADEVRLFDAHANLVQRHPGAFVTLSAHTLSGDPRLLHLSVRRLLILLRKICLRVGARYTFEVNNDRFRQLVRMRFDRILAALADRGAVHAFRIVTDGSVNTPVDQDSGRFVVALQIAPTNPVEFITVTLLRSGEDLLDVLEG